MFHELGRSGGIRTHDPFTPSKVRYQAALRSDISFIRPLGHFGNSLLSVPARLKTHLNLDETGTLTRKGSIPVRFDLVVNYLKL